MEISSITGEKFELADEYILPLEALFNYDKEDLPLMTTVESCIYAIQDSDTNKVYVGQTTRSLYKRFRCSMSAHLSRYKECEESSERNIYTLLKLKGIESFRVLLLEFDSEDLDRSEQYWIKFFDSVSNGYNGNSGARNVEQCETDEALIRSSTTKLLKSIENKRSIYKSLSDFNTNNYEIDFYIRNWPNKRRPEYIDHIDRICIRWKELSERDKSLKTLFFFIDPSSRETTELNANRIWWYYMENLYMTKEFAETFK